MDSIEEGTRISKEELGGMGIKVSRYISAYNVICFNGDGEIYSFADSGDSLLCLEKAVLR